MKPLEGDNPSPRASHQLHITMSSSLTCSWGPFSVALAGGHDPGEPGELQPGQEMPAGLPCLYHVKVLLFFFNRKSVFGR